MKKILILGASGFVGTALFQYFSQKKEYYAIGTYCQHYSLPIAPPNPLLQNVDILEEKRLQALLKQTDPDIIINTIAIPNIDICEENHERCDLINVSPTKTITSYCKKHPKIYLFLF